MNLIRFSPCDFEKEMKTFLIENNLSFLVLYSMHNTTVLNILLVTTLDKKPKCRFIIEEEFAKDMAFEESLKERKIIVSNNKNGFLSKDSDFEMYIPIKLEEKDAGFVLLSSQNKIENINLDTFQDIFEKHSHCLARLAYLRWSELSVSRTLAIADMFFTEKRAL